MPNIVLADLDVCKQKACSCSCGFEVSGNFISSLKFIHAPLQCSLGHSTAGSITSEMGLGIEVLQPTQTKWHFLVLFFFWWEASCLHQEHLLTNIHLPSVFRHVQLPLLLPGLGPCSVLLYLYI